MAESGLRPVPLQGDGWAVGYDVGMLWKPIKQLSLGAAFKSTTSFNFEGHTAVHQ